MTSKGPVDEKMIQDALMTLGLGRSEIWVEETYPQGLPPIPGEGFVFGVVEADSYGDGDLIVNLMITTVENMPFLSDYYTEPQRDYIEAALEKSKISAGESMESVWEVENMEAHMVRAALLLIPGFRFDSDFEEAMKRSM